MTTRERFVEQLREALGSMATSDDDDDELVGLLQLARGFGLGPSQIADTFAKILPADDAAADAWIEKVVGFVLSLRTDAAIAARPGAEFPSGDLADALRAPEPAPADA